MRTLAIPILGLFLLFGCGGGEQEASDKPTEPVSQESSLPSVSQEPSLPSVSQEPSLPSVSQEPSLPSVSQEPSLPSVSQEPSLPPVSQEPSLPTDPDAERSGAEDFGDIAGDADLSVSDRSRTSLIGGDSDRVDYYRFSLTESKRVILRQSTLNFCDKQD